MRRMLSIGICLLVANSVYAGPIGGTISGSFPTGDSIELPGGAALKIGTPESRLVFSSAGTFDGTPGETFYLGSFRFENESLGDANSSGVFQASFRFSNFEGIDLAHFNFELTLEQDPGDLVVTITVDCKSEETFRLPTGEEFTLVLNGFSPTRELGPDTALRESFESEFCVDGVGYLYATFVPAGDTCPQVPEPGSLLLVGTGLGLVALRRRGGKSGAIHLPNAER